MQVAVGRKRITLNITSCHLTESHPVSYVAPITLIKEIYPPSFLFPPLCLVLSLTWPFLRSLEFCFSFLLLGSRVFLSCSSHSWLIETEVIQEMKLILLLMLKNVKCKQCKEQEIECAVKCISVAKSLVSEESRCGLQMWFTTLLQFVFMPVKINKIRYFLFSNCLIEMIIVDLWISFHLASPHITLQPLM